MTIDEMERVQQMKVVVAIDSLKGSLPSIKAGRAIAEGIKKADETAQVEVRPLADGGEGTVDALTYGMGGTIRRMKAVGPAGNVADCYYGVIENKKMAIIEISSAAGITLVNGKERNPLYTTTYGVGEMIKDAIQIGCRHFVIGLGGSATNDGGVGMLQALGFDFKDENGKPIPKGADGLAKLKTVSCDNVIPELKECHFRVACDVENPLCGDNGCSAIYGPQKGATKEMVTEMDEWLGAYAEKVKAVIPDANPTFPGAGAAGGLGFAFQSFTDAVLESGISIVLDETSMEDYIKDADLVITGEGRLDGQTAMGKAPMGVAHLAKKYNIPVVALAGMVTKDATACNHDGIDAYFSILQNVCTLEEAMDSTTAYENLKRTAEQVFRLWLTKERSVE